MKGITVILILSMFFSFFACMSTRKLTQKDEIRTTLESGNRFYLYTDNSEIYYFDSPQQYQISNDTIVGLGQVVNDSSSGSNEYVRIAIENISKIKVKKYDEAKTGKMIGVVLAVAVTGYLYYSMIDDINNMWD